MPMLPRGRMFRMEMVNIEKMPPVLPQWRCPQNLFLYHHVSPGRSPSTLLKMTGMSKLTVHPEGLSFRFSRVRQEVSTMAMMTMVGRIMRRRFWAWRWTR